ncbi:hypothetical protein V5T82_07240 [Magnetovibrio sp. PR-2]|uniref:hypothetical protein n=1 Tax=Magnetovibrio sp. PR-2 TaxID=3120356 RepID=UPI002FCE1520
MCGNPFSPPKPPAPPPVPDPDTAIREREAKAKSEALTERNKRGKSIAGSQTINQKTGFLGVADLLGGSPKV